jgi:pyrroline-5-carboxylate reductase
MPFNKKLAILGAGNLGTSIARGLYESGKYKPKRITLTRRHIERLEAFAKLGFKVQRDNSAAVKDADILLITVEPQKINELLEEIAPVINADRHIVISCVTGVSIAQIRKKIGKPVPVVRSMPNTAIAIRQSMTCLASEKGNGEALKMAREIFSTVGKTLEIEEEQMAAATALAACGIAFFLRGIRAASQGGIEIGFDSEKALFIAAQTALGSAQLLLEHHSHPESEIDRVTTPRGITISGLNQMEHEGFSSAMITGIVTAWEKAAKVYK